MNISKIFVKRPVATIVLMLAVIIFGLFAYPYLAVSELPDVDFPTLVVTASLPGADPETMATTVATPIEKSLSTVSGIDSMTSESSAGSTRITLQFALDRNIDAAAQDAQSALLQVQRQLPDEMRTPPTIRKVNPADSPVLYIALTAQHLKMSQLDEYAQNVISPRISMSEGVAQVNVYGAQTYAVRVYVNPSALTNRNLTLDDLATNIAGVNTNQPSGTLLSEGSYKLLKSDGQLVNAAQFSNATIAAVNGAPVKLQDVATVIDSVQNDKALTWFNHQRAIVLAIQRQPGANTVAVTQRILKLLPQMSANLPGDAKLNVFYNRADFIKESINEVQYTLVFAAILVMIVIFIFLRNISSSVIALFSLPTSIIATFGCMYLLGYSLDNLSLMGLVLAVGFVIDDAVVMIENIIRYFESGLDKLTATLKGSGEIAFTIVAMTISLVAVFIPIFFMGGMIGRLFYEFAAVVGIAILASGVVALTLIPMLCSRFLYIPKKTHPALLSLEKGFDRARDWYEKTLRWSVSHQRFILIISIFILIAIGVLFHFIPKGFLPDEDTGRIVVSIEATEGIAFDDFVKQQQRAVQIVLNNKNVDALFSSVGQGAGGVAGASSGRMFIRLKPMNDRPDSASQVIQTLRHSLSVIPSLKFYLTSPPAINVGGKVASSTYQYVLQSTSWDALESATTKMQEAMQKINGIQDVNSDLKFNNPELKIHILRDRCGQLGVTPTQIESALYSAFGNRVVTSILTAAGDFDVIMAIAPEFQKDPSAINQVYVRSTTTNRLVPLSSVVTAKAGIGPLEVNHYAQLPAVTLSFNLAPGASLGGVTQAVNQLGKKILPQTVTGGFSGAAETFEASLVTLPILLLFTILVIYMVLAILYEHFSYPLTILTALPFAVFGALLALMIFHQELDLFSFIGLIMLVGLTKKNGIMMVDFAVEAERQLKLQPKEAIIHACIIRFRPIMMTTMSALVATLPLAMGMGAGAEMRRALGISVVGGLLFSQLITLYVTPVFYLWMGRLGDVFKRRREF